MPFKLSKRSKDNLIGAHPAIVQVTLRAAELSAIEFIVTESIRTVEKQRHYVKTGASKTMNSRHLSGKAVDLVAVPAPGKVSYAAKEMKLVRDAMFAASKELSIPIEWGGDWKSFKDTPHFELDRKAYP